MLEEIYNMVNWRGKFRGPPIGRDKIPEASYSNATWRKALEKLSNLPERGKNFTRTLYLYESLGEHYLAIVKIKDK